MKKSILLFFFPVFMSLGTYAQSFHVNAQNVKLNDLLIQLRGQYDLKTSFDDHLLSQYLIRVNKSFPDQETLIRYLLKDFPLDYEKQGDIFVIYPRISHAVLIQKKNQLFSGHIFDIRSGEPLPYSHVLINGQGVISDLSGQFSMLLPTSDSLYHLRISQLGYYVLDTTLAASFEQAFALHPSTVKLMEVKITGHLIDFGSQLGEQAGITKLNSQIANHLPGFGDNSIFNLLRLQPGILASGEQTNDLIIWGSYEGQSKVIFDGFTIYGLTNFNDNISAFNPYMAKDVEIMKGGFDARYGGRIGGIIDITGINGNRQKPSFSLNINNMTLNALLEIPVNKRASLVMALRHTYFNLYNPTQYSLKRRDSTNQLSTIDLAVIPNYMFRDMNIKYSGTTKNNDLYYLSLYGGSDHFTYHVSQDIYKHRFLKETGEQNQQIGGSFFYGRQWAKGGSSHLTLSFSNLDNEYADEVKIERIKTGEIVDSRRSLTSTNQMKELTAKLDNRLPISPGQQLEYGMAYIINSSQNTEDTFAIARLHLSMTGRRLVFYAQDVIQLGQKFKFKIGGRNQYAINLQRNYLDPRLSLHITPNSICKINFAWGVYHQFIAKSSVLDDEGNYRYVWAVADNLDVPVLRSVHRVMGITFFKNNFTFNTQAYYKTIEGLTRFVRYKNLIPPNIYHGTGRSYGLDIMIKKEYKGSSAWLAYSLSRTEEIFDYFLKKTYHRAPQDQRHELKAALLINLNPLFVSANYVYGSGFPANISTEGHSQADVTYSRIDVSVAYRFLNKKVKGEAGLSLMNVLNRHNIKFSNFERIPLDQSNSINIFAEAMPRTPSLYLNIKL